MIDELELTYETIDNELNLLITASNLTQQQKAQLRNIADANEKNYDIFEDTQDLVKQLQTQQDTIELLEYILDQTLDTDTKKYWNRKLDVPIFKFEEKN